MRVAQLTVPTLTGSEALPVLNNVLQRMIFAINNIEFGSVEASSENVYCTFLVVTTGLANTCASALHGLRKKPVGTVCVWQDKAGIWYKPTDATSADTTNAMFYICNTAATSAVLLIF